MKKINLLNHLKILLLFLGQHLTKVLAKNRKRKRIPCWKIKKKLKIVKQVEEKNQRKLNIYIERKNIAKPERIKIRIVAY